MKKLIYHIFLILAPFLCLRASFCSSSIKLSLLEKEVAKLFIVPGFADLDRADPLFNFLENYPVTGVIFGAGTSLELVDVINRSHLMAKRPLLFTIDAEWGLNMRLKDAPSYPYQLTLGAVTDLSLIEQLGKAIGEDLKLLNLHWNLAPVVDVKTNPHNPVIRMRSFGSDPYDVAEHALSLIRGMQEEGIITCAKHFPGHGDTSIDSHIDLPVIDHDRERLDSIELLPFRKVIENGVDSIMIGHLLARSLDDENPASLSKKVISELLKQEMGFHGIVITDSLSMGALSDKPSDEVALMAFEAGSDLLLYLNAMDFEKEEHLEKTIPLAIKAIANAIEEGKIPYSRLLESLEKIKRVKPTQLSFVEKPSIEKWIAKRIDLKKQLYQKAITLVKNDDHLLPIKQDELIAVLQIEGQKIPPIFSSLPRVFPTSSIEYAKKYKAILIPHLNESRITLQEKEFIENSSLKTITLFLAPPFDLDEFTNSDAIVVAYEDDPLAQESALELIYGSIEPVGRLPLDISKDFPIHTKLSF